MSKKSRAAGKLLTIDKRQPKVEPAEPANSYALSDTQKEALTGLVTALDKAKAKLGDFVVNVEIQKHKLLQHVTESSNELNNMAGTIAAEHGIDVSDPSKGRWNLDTDTMTLNRTA